MCDLYICRICLNTAVKGYKLEQQSLRIYYEYVVRQKLNTKDRLPQWVCYECAMMLHKFHKFKEKCLQGQHVLKQILWKGNISYESVEQVNRYTENLASPVAVAIASKRVKTMSVKHKHKLKRKMIVLERDMLNFDSDDSMKHEELDIYVESENIFEKSLVDINKKNNKKFALEQVEIKTETNILNAESVKSETSKLDSEIPHSANNTFDSIQNSSILTSEPKIDLPNIITDIGNINTDIGNTDKDIETDINADDDMGNRDHVDRAMSSDDENIFLNIVKKAVKGESKLVFLDNIEVKPVRKKKKYTKKMEHSKGKVHKFEKPKKEYLTPEHWRKFNLSEEEAMHEFKQREISDQYVNANYKCHNCLKGFSKVEMLMRHVKFRHEECCGPIECRFCHMRFKQKNKLCKHLKQHYAVYQCLRCDMRFRLESSAIFHEDYHNGVTRKCKHCGEEFKHSSTYYTHLRMSHRSAHVCVACGASFVSAAGLQQHRRIKHYSNSDEASSEPVAADTYCAKCDIKFESQAAYDEHLTHSNMHGDLNTDSEIARSNLKGNKKIAPQSYKGLRKKKPTTCQYCGKHFATQGQCMKHHLAEHPRRSFYPPDKRHICEVCGQSLAAVSIASHMNRHTREHVYPCATCGMQFISKSSHHRHQVTHTGERPYPCPLCEKRFTQKNSMQLHYRTFHLKQPYPKRNRRKKTDVEIPIMECAINRDRCHAERSDLDTNDTPPISRWRATF